MGMFGVASAQKRWQVCMVFASRGLLEVAGWTFLNSYSMRWVMVLEWSFGSMCGVRIVPSKRLFQNFTILVGQGMLQWQRLWGGLVEGFIGMFDFVVHLRIGSKNLLIGLWALSTLQLWGGLALIRFFEIQLGVEALRLEDFIFLSTLQLLLLSLGEWCGKRRFLQG